MRARRVVPVIAIMAMMGAALAAVSGTAAASTTAVSIQKMIKRGSVSFGKLGRASGTVSAAEYAKASALVNRSLSRRPTTRTGRVGVPKVTPNIFVKKSRPQAASQIRSFEGLNHHDQRTANGGNQFSLEPPDQGLCVGNNYVIEVINDVLRIYNNNGVPLSNVKDLNTFFGYPPEINRQTGQYGPFPTDPSCYYDPEHGVFVVIMLTLDTDPNSGDFLGTNHLDIAVSQTSNPLGNFNLYSIPAQDDGSQGTPNHNCSGGPCIGDFPHLGADRYGFYITTNEYSFFGPEFHTAQIYAMSKAKLASGAPIIPFLHFQNLHLAKQNGFTVWPAQSNPGKYNTANHGTEYFLSSMAAAETGNPNGMASTIGLWTMVNTRSLDFRSPHLFLNNKILNSAAYGIPPLSNQQVGDVPLADCMANPPCFNFSDGQIASSVEGPLDSSDSRMFQVWYAAGKLWSALDTIVAVSAPDPPFYAYEAAVLWFVVNPAGAGSVQNQGYVVAPPNGDNANNITYPAVAVLPNGKGILAANLVGVDFYPSQIWVEISAAGIGGTGEPNGGVGPQDGFSEYLAFTPGHARPRWGDYSAAVTEGGTVWLANEVINQTCMDAEFNADPTCGGTRTALGNWSTQITQVKV